MRAIFTVLFLYITFIFTVHLCPGYTSQNEKIFGQIVGIDASGKIHLLEKKKPLIVLSAKEIYHYQTLRVYLYNVQKMVPEKFYLKVYKNGIEYPSLGKISNIPFRKDGNRLKSVYLPGWNQQDGTYQVKVYYSGNLLRTKQKLEFCIKRRKVPQIEKGISVVNLEMNQSIKNATFFGPDGYKKASKAVLEWARFMEADTLWVLAGETTTFTGSFIPDFPWDQGPLENLHILKRDAGNYGIAIGAYIMSFYVPGPHGITNRYQPATGYDPDNDTLYHTNHISLACDTRIRDIIKLAENLQNDPEVAYIGLDFIRTGKSDGYELAPLVVEQTNISTPPDWQGYSKTKKIKWFAEKIMVEKDPLIIEKWRWWRAHRVAEILNQVIDEAGITKPVWVYTLGWNHGKEHGQDPVMLFDAGATIDAVMLYEANSGQFERMMKHWEKYTRNTHGNFLVGNCVDYTLLDSELYTPPVEFYRRNTQGYKSMMGSGCIAGIFFHDIYRALRGKRGGYTIRDYAVAHLSSIYKLRNDLYRKGLYHSDIFVDVTITGAEDHTINHFSPGMIKGSIHIKNNSDYAVENIHIESCTLPANWNILYNYQNHLRFSECLNLDRLKKEECRDIEFFLINNRTNATMNSICFRVEVGKKKEYYLTALADFRLGRKKISVLDTSTVKGHN